MASLLTAVAQTVNGLINTSQQTGDTTTMTTTASDAVQNETVANAEQTMDIDSIAVNTVQPTAEPPLGTAETPTEIIPVVASKEEATTEAPVTRASSLPLTLNGNTTSRYGYVYDDRMMLHTPLNEHPESPARIQGIYQKLREGGCLARMRQVRIRKVTKDEVLLVHSDDHWDKVQMIAQMNVEQIVMSQSYYEHLSLYVSPQTTLAALLSCGGVIEAALAVARGHIEKSFAIVRPPGHHAEPEEHMGFCFFNNIAVATRVVQQLTPMKRILILDWDVHHGNGTQRAFQDDPTVLYISLHRFEGGAFYPCGPFGGMDSCGEGQGLGMSVNIPWPEAGMGDPEYLHAFMRIVMPIAMEFAPDLVMISAGFDAADGDELGECHVTPAGFAHMTHMLSSLAGGRLVVALEGGYNVESISNSALAVTRVLLGDAPPEMKSMVANELATETVWAVAIQQSKFWKSIDPKACEPAGEIEEEIISIPELLKLHRQEHLYQKYKMVQLPLMDSEIDERFKAQALCSPDVLEKQVLVLFVHQFGNLRVELAGAMTCDVNVEHSYLLDVTKSLIAWVRNRDFAYVEVNTYPRPPLHNHKRTWTELGRDVLTYLWDNYLQLSNASQIILFGHGPGCTAVMELIAARAQSVMQKVSSVVLVVGQDDIPQIPRDEDELRKWYIRHSYVVVPQLHPFVTEGRLRKRHGMVRQYDERKPVKLLSRALSDIQTFIDDKLDSSVLAQNRPNGTVPLTE